MTQHKRSRIPTAGELLEAVAGYLEAELLPELEGRQRFNTRVSINALRIVQRELTQPTDPAILAELRELLGADNGDAEALLLRLAEQIRAGAVDESNPALLALLRRLTLERLGVDNPRYSSYLAATEKSFFAD